MSGTFIIFPQEDFFLGDASEVPQNKMPPWPSDNLVSKTTRK